MNDRRKIRWSAAGLIVCAVSCAHDIVPGSFVDARPAAPLSIAPNASELAAARQIDAARADSLGFLSWPALCVAPWLALLGAASMDRARLRRGYDAVVREGPILPGRRALEGTVEPIDEAVPLRIVLAEDLRSVSSATTSAFFLRLATGERVRVDCSKPIELRLPSFSSNDVQEEFDLDVRIVTGMRVAVEGIVKGEGSRATSGPYREGKSSEIVAAEDLPLVITEGGATPLHRARIDAAWRGIALALVGLVTFAVIVPFESLSLRWTGVSQWGAIIAHRSTQTNIAATQSTAAPSVATVANYALRVRVDDRVIDDDVPGEVQECAREGLCTRVPVVLSTYGPPRARVATRPFFEFDMALMSLGGWLLATLVYAGIRRERCCFVVQIDPAR